LTSETGFAIMDILRKGLRDAQDEEPAFEGKRMQVFLRLKK